MIFSSHLTLSVTMALLRIRDWFMESALFGDIACARCILLALWLYLIIIIIIITSHEIGYCFSHSASPSHVHHTHIRTTGTL